MLFQLWEGIKIDDDKVLLIIKKYYIFAIVEI